MEYHKDRFSDHYCSCCIPQTWADLPRNLGSRLTSTRMTHSSTRQVRGPVACFVITQVDRCNSLLAGVPKCLLGRLTSVLSSAARLVCNCREYDHVRPLLRDRLHWLPVQYRIDYKLALIVYRYLHGAVPDYLKSYCVLVSKSREGARLRSEVKGDLKVRKSKTVSAIAPFLLPGSGAGITSQHS